MERCVRLYVYSRKQNALSIWDYNELFKMEKWMDSLQDEIIHTPCDKNIR